MRAILLTAFLAALPAVSLVPAAGAKTLCTVVADAATGKVLKQEGTCDERVTAASTFKIAISLMGYDAGFLKDEHHPALPFRKGYPDWLSSWRRTTDPTAWIANSVVWYSQQVTQALGEDRFRRYVTAFHYGNEDVSGDPGKHDGLTRAWLSSSLRISPLEEVAFLEKLVEGRLPVSHHAVEMTRRLTAVGVLPDGWDVHGKTGSGFPTAADGSKDEDHGYGWFVGWATKNGRTLVFARLGQNDDRKSGLAGLRVRDGLMRELPAILDAL